MGLSRLLGRICESRRDMSNQRRTPDYNDCINNSLSKDFSQLYLISRPSATGVSENQSMQIL
jgi:hypothetical protein